MRDQSGKKGEDMKAKADMSIAEITVRWKQEDKGTEETEAK